LIGIISGKVIFSDGHETIINTSTGIGYQTFCHHILPEGEMTSLFISHVIRETKEDLYCFKTLREKKLFELLTTVKGVGPKSAFNLVSNISVDEIIQAIQSDQKKVLTQVTGVGAKAASQMILDLQKKITKVKMYSNERLKLLNKNSLGSIGLEAVSAESASTETASAEDKEKYFEPSMSQSILDDTILACKNLGFQSEKIIPLAQKILRENQIKKTEQLVHLVLKEV